MTFSTAKLAQKSDGTVAARIFPSDDVRPWVSTGGSCLSDQELEDDEDWRIVGLVSPDLIDKDMVERAVYEARYWEASKDISENVIFAILTAALTPNRPDPEITGLIYQYADDVKDGWSAEGLAQWLTENGVKKV